MSRWLRLFVVPLFGLVFVMAQSSTQKPQTWGAFTVRLETITREGLSNMKATVTDAKKNVFAILEDEMVDATQGDYTGDGVPELLLTAYSGGAHCCTTYYLFDRSSGTMKNILAYAASNYRGLEPKDLGGGKRLELLVFSDALAYFEVSYADSPGVRMVLEWNGSRYKVATMKYPKPALSEMTEYQRDLLQSVNADSGTLKGMVLGVYANGVSAGAENVAEAWIRQHVTVKLLNWFLPLRETVRRAVEGSRCKVGITLDPELKRWQLENGCSR
jgi:hypothetical protein